MSYLASWPLRRSSLIARERVLPAGHGRVTVAVDDFVEPNTVIVDTTPPLYAGIRGRVGRVIPERGVVIEGLATVLTATCGFGGIVAGPLHVLSPDEVTAVTVMPPGSIVLFERALTSEVLFAAQASHVAAVIAASGSSHLIDTYVGGDCTALLDGSILTPPALPFSLVLLHGFGPGHATPDLWRHLQSYAGQVVLCHPHTNVLRGWRPELIVAESRQTAPLTEGDPNLSVGATVWISGLEEGSHVGTIASILTSGQILPSGIRAYAASVRLQNGTKVIAPLANIQRVG
jgi:hypothetical protein